MTPVYVFDGTPGAEAPRKWTDVCHSRGPFVGVDYRPVYNPTTKAPRSFRVTYYSRRTRGALLGSTVMGRYATLTAAVQAAHRFAGTPGAE